MAAPQRSIAPYGSWRSAITAEIAASAAIGIGQIAVDGEDIYWVESRPEEAGRNVIVRWSAGDGARDLTPAPFSARTRAHEYGGGAFAVGDGVVFFSNFTEQRIYRQGPGAAPQPVTPPGNFRYADLAIDPRRARLVCVREDHSAAGAEPANTLVSIDLEGRDAPLVVAKGCDFYSTPRFSPDAARLSWLSWNHPNMPWDGTDLWVGELGADGTVVSAERVAGGPEESIFQPEWSPGGDLHFVSDRTGWWNLYRRRHGEVEALLPMDADFAVPQWNFGLSTYAFASDERICCAYTSEGRWHLAWLDTRHGNLQLLDLPYSDFSSLRIAGGDPVVRAASPAAPAVVLRLEAEGNAPRVLRRSSAVQIDTEFVSRPRSLRFPASGGHLAHAFYYAPRNPDYAAPEDTRPPLVVISHGGPTSAATTAFDLRIQYWTSRGFAVVDVNYGGSTGFGREYRRRLDGQWGVVDVEDCVCAARHLAASGEVDPHRLLIRGSSAGGFTALCALTFGDVFRAGASYYGISDLEALARDTHKFESRYEHRLVGPYPARADLYRQRSPIHFTERLSCPIIFFQGLDDRVVPADQTERMVAAMQAKRLPVAYVPFAGEQHGFRRAESIRRSLEAELFFYSRVLGFSLAEPIEPVTIDNLR